MRRALTAIVALFLGLGVTAAIVINTEAGQDMLIERAMLAVVAAEPSTPPEGGMRVFVCGSASPLPAPGRAQACIAIQVDERVYVVDAGAGSANAAMLGLLPVQNLRTIFLTHYHSDHISGIGDMNVISWANGRTGALPLVGPVGVNKVAAGLNEAYTLDRGYRVAHHGRELMAPKDNILEPRTIDPGIVLDENGLKVIAFKTHHDPVFPAVGYRFEYGGRSVVVTGDTIVTDAVLEASQDADLVMTDALSLPIVTAMERGSRAAGRERQAKILKDIQDYHASANSLNAFIDDAGVGMIALYHMVPGPRNTVMERIFLRDLPAGTVLTRDGMVIDLPAMGGIVVDP